VPTCNHARTHTHKHACVHRQYPSPTSTPSTSHSLPTRPAVALLRTTTLTIPSPLHCASDEGVEGRGVARWHTRHATHLEVRDLELVVGAEAMCLRLLEQVLKGVQCIGHTHKVNRRVIVITFQQVPPHMPTQKETRHSLPCQPASQRVEAIKEVTDARVPKRISERLHGTCAGAEASTRSLPAALAPNDLSCLTSNIFCQTERTLTPPPHRGQQGSVAASWAGRATHNTQFNLGQSTSPAHSTPRARVGGGIQVVIPSTPRAKK